MKLILISGAEATCKSDLGQRLAKELGYTYQSKDHIKEAMYDSENHSTWDFNWYEKKAKDTFFKDIKSFLSRHTNAIIESNFLGKDKKRLSDLLAYGGVELVEIHCFTTGFISFRRAVHRNESGVRHRGHHDRRWYPKVFVQSTLRLIGIPVGAHRAVAINDKVLLLDTSKYPEIDFDSVLRFVES